MNNYINAMIAFLFCMVPMIVFKIKKCIPKANQKTHFLMTIGWAGISFYLLYYQS